MDASYAIEATGLQCGYENKVVLTELSFAEPEFARMRRHRDQMVRSGMLSRRTAQ